MRNVASITKGINKFLTTSNCVTNVEEKNAEKVKFKVIRARVRKKIRSFTFRILLSGQNSKGLMSKGITKKILRKLTTSTVGRYKTVATLQINAFRLEKVNLIDKIFS